MSADNFLWLVLCLVACAAGVAGWFLGRASAFAEAARLVGQTFGPPREERPNRGTTRTGPGRKLPQGGSGTAAPRRPAQGGSGTLPPPPTGNAPPPLRITQFGSEVLVQWGEGMKADLIRCEGEASASELVELIPRVFMAGWEHERWQAKGRHPA